MTQDEALDLRILVVDDEEFARNGLLRLLRMIQGPHRFDVREADSGAEALELLRDVGADCILLDYGMPGGSGLDWMPRLLEAVPHAAVIIVTGEGDETVAARSIKDGATDYLAKGSISPWVLKRTILNAVEKIKMQLELEAQRLKLLDAERHRVMVESLGAACHRLGQPATVITTSLQILKREIHGEEEQRMLGECMQAAESLSSILQQLQRVCVYRTEPYLTPEEGEPDTLRTRILTLSDGDPAAGPS